MHITPSETIASARGAFRRIRSLLPLLAALTVVLGVAVAAAHARYDHSTPAAGQVVPVAPPRVDIFTVQDMAKQQGANEITVSDANGNRVDDGNTVVDDADRKHFSVGLKPNLPPGRYVVSFKNLSDEDGERDQGQFAFYVGTGPTSAQKALDAKLKITSKKEESSSHTGLIIGIVAAVIVVLILAGGGVWYARRKRRRV